jgi:hypothetical protein
MSPSVKKPNHVAFEQAASVLCGTHGIAESSRQETDSAGQKAEKQSLLWKTTTNLTGMFTQLFHKASIISIAVPGSRSGYCIHVRHQRAAPLSRQTLALGRRKTGLLKGAAEPVLPGQELQRPAGPEPEKRSLGVGHEIVRHHVVPTDLVLDGARIVRPLVGRREVGRLIGPRDVAPATVRSYDRRVE